MNGIFDFIIWNVRPTVFESSEIPRWYGICWAVGIGLSMLIMRHIYKTEKRSLGEIDRLTIYLIVGTILGARLGHILFYDPVYYWQNPMEILPISFSPTFHITGLAGLASHGGAIGLIIAILLYSRKSGTNFFWLIDRIAIIAALSGAFIRFGNLMNSEMIGVPTSVPWAFIFTRVDSIPRHPAQLYESIYCFILFIITYQLWSKKRAQIPNGLIFSIFITILFSLRFVDEFFKINQEFFEDQLLINMGQILSIPFIIAGVIMSIISLRNHSSRLSNSGR